MMVTPSITGNLAHDPYARPPAREDVWRDPFVVGSRLRRTMPPTAVSAFGPGEESPFRPGAGPAAAESAASVLHAIWTQHLHKNLIVTSLEPAQPATWLPSALKELEEMDREIREDGLPGIKAETTGEAARILRELDGQVIPPTTYPTDDGEIVIHFASPGTPAAVLIELSNDGQGACFSCVGGKNRRARYDDSSDLPDAFVMAQLEALAAEAARK